MGVLTREDVGDGEDAERPPDGAQLGLLDQILDALHPLPHLGLRARAPCGAARPVGGGGGLRWDRFGCGIPHPKGLRHRRRRRPGRALPAATRLHGDFYFWDYFAFFGIFFENLYKNVPRVESNQPLSSVVGPTLADACRRMPCGSQSPAGMPLPRCTLTSGSFM